MEGCIGLWILPITQESYGQFGPEGTETDKDKEWAVDLVGHDSLSQNEKPRECHIKNAGRGIIKQLCMLYTSRIYNAP